VLPLDPERWEDVEAVGAGVESVLCINVLEYVNEPAEAIRNIARVIAPDGCLMVLVPQGTSIYSAVDKTLGHKRRFDLAPLAALLKENGFEITRTYQMNKIGTPAWWLYGKVLGRASINKVTLKIYDKTVWFWRRVEALMPWNGLSLIVVARRVA
jgi:hypothetical protein